MLKLLGIVILVIAAGVLGFGVHPLWNSWVGATPTPSTVAIPTPEPAMTADEVLVLIKEYFSAGLESLRVHRAEEEKHKFDRDPSKILASSQVYTLQNIEKAIGSLESKGLDAITYIGHLIWVAHLSEHIYLFDETNQAVEEIVASSYEAKSLSMLETGTSKG